MKKQFRICLYPGSNTLCNTLAILAAKFNGGANAMTIEQIKTVAEGNILEYPSMNEGFIVEQVGEHTLHIDKKGDTEYSTVLSLDLIEIGTLKMQEEEV